MSVVLRAIDWRAREVFRSMEEQAMPQNRISFEDFVYLLSRVPLSFWYTTK